MDPFFGFEYEHQWVGDDAETFPEFRPNQPTNIPQSSDRSLQVQSLQPDALVAAQESEEWSITKVSQLSIINKR